MKGHAATAATTRRVAVAIALLSCVAIAAIAGADRSTAQGPTTVSVAEAVERSCFARPLGDAPGATAVTVADPGTPAIVEARLDGPAGSDWDLAVFDGAGTRGRGPRR